MVKVSARLNSAARIASALAGLKLRFPGGVVLCYHDIQPTEQICTGYTVTPETLRSQLVDARRYGLVFVTLEDMVDRWMRSANTDGLAAVVFDDAFVGVHRYAAEVLADLSIPGTIYPLTLGLGRRPAWWPGAQRTLTGAEMAELRALGWTVGSHTRTHRSLPSLTIADIKTEIVISKNELEDQIQRPVSTLAYPFGHHNPAVREIARESGYDVGFTFLNGRITNDLDAFMLPRLTMTMESQGTRWAVQLLRTADSWPNTQIDCVTDGTP